LEEYLVPTGFGEDEFTEKKSRFIGRVWLVETEEEAYKLIDTLPPAKNEYHSFAKAYRVVKA
jgi:putative IMPACT (imprinted ancient) family translation regulator